MKNNQFFAFAFILSFGIGQSMFSESLLNVPVGSKVVFTKDVTIPPNETKVKIGESKANGFITTCTLVMNKYDPSVRMIKKGTEFKIRDTAQGFNDSLEMVFESNSIRSIACLTSKPVMDKTKLQSEDDFKMTQIVHAEKAIHGHAKLHLNKEPIVIAD
jgi:hypothetical protein